jgi:hypothetical protein
MAKRPPSTGATMTGTNFDQSKCSAICITLIAPRRPISRWYSVSTTKRSTSIQSKIGAGPGESGEVGELKRLLLSGLNMIVSKLQSARIRTCHLCTAATGSDCQSARHGEPRAAGYKAARAIEGAGYGTTVSCH